MTPWVQKYEVDKKPSGLLVASVTPVPMKNDIPEMIYGVPVVGAETVKIGGDSINFGPSLVSKMYPAWRLSQELPAEFSEGRAKLAKDIIDAHNEFERRLDQTAIGQWSREVDVYE